MLFFAIIGVLIAVIGVHTHDGILAILGATCAILNGINYVTNRKGVRK